MLTPDFSKPEDLRPIRRHSWTGSIELVVDKYDGSLKAEHGTGVNMAPFVEREWGPKATEPDVAGEASSPIPTACSPRA